MSDRQYGSRPITIDGNTESGSTARSRLNDSNTDLSESIPVSAQRSTCPDGNILIAFTSGLLPLDTCEAIAQHVETCEDCQRRLDEQSCQPPHDAMHEALAALAQVEQLSPIGLDQRRAIEALAPPMGEVAALARLEHFHEYHLLEQIGKGGMGTVYRALHTRLNKEVAVKTISPAAFTIPGAVARFESEMRALGQISHPNIVSASDAGVFQQTHYLVMEYIKGTDLAELLKARGRLDVPLVVHILSQVCAGLSAAHRCGLVHRDIKPSNIMLMPDTTGLGTVKILDLGLSALHPDVALAQPTSNQATSDQANESSEVNSASRIAEDNQAAIVGTFDYMAPEQAHRGTAPSPGMDLYSLGCTCFHLLVGRAPFRQLKSPGNVVSNDVPGVARQALEPMTPREKLAAHAQSPVPSVKQFRDDVPDWLSQLIERMMAKEPGQRPQSVEEVLGTVAQARSKEHAGRRSLKVLLIALAMFACLFCGVVYRVVTDKGTLEITPLDEKVQVEISQNGKRVKIVDTENSNRIELRSGQFDLKVANRQDVTIDKTSVTLKRGDRVVVQLKFLSDIARADQVPSAAPPLDPRVEVRQSIVRVMEGDLQLPGLHAVMGRPMAAEALQGLSIKTLEFSPDGKWLAAGTSAIGQTEEAIPGELLIIQAESGDVHHRLQLHKSGINKVAWAKDSQLVLSGSYDGNILAIDPSTGQQRHKFDLNNSVFGLGFSENGEQLAVSCGHTVFILAWPSGKVLQRLATKGPGVRDAVFRGNSEVITNGVSSPSHVWTLGDQPLLRTYAHFGSMAGDVAVPKISVADGAEPIVWSGGYDGRCLAWNTQSGRVSKQLLHPWVVSTVDASADGAHVLTSDWTGSARLWNSATGQLEKVLHGRAACVARFHPSEKSIAVGGQRNGIYAVDVTTGQSIWPTRAINFGKSKPTTNADTERWMHASEIWRVGSSESTPRVASAALDGSVVLWDSDSHRMLASLEHQGGQSLLLEFIDNGRRLVCVTHESFVTEWDVDTHAALSATWCATAGNVRNTAAAIDPQGELIALARELHGLELWSRSEKRLVRALKDGPNGVSQLAFSKDGQQLWALDRGRLCCWEVASGLEKNVTGVVSANCLCRLDNRLIVASTNGKVTVLDNEGNKLAEFEAPCYPIDKLKANTQGDQLAAISWAANRVAVWKLADDKAQLKSERTLIPEELLIAPSDCDWNFRSEQSFIGHPLGVILVGR